MTATHIVLALEDSARFEFYDLFSEASAVEYPHGIDWKVGWSKEGCLIRWTDQYSPELDDFLAEVRQRWDLPVAEIEQVEVDLRNIETLSEEELNRRLEILVTVGLQAHLRFLLQVRLNLSKEEVDARLVRIHARRLIDAF